MSKVSPLFHIFSVSKVEQCSYYITKLVSICISEHKKRKFTTPELLILASDFQMEYENQFLLHVTVTGMYHIYNQVFCKG